MESSCYFEHKKEISTLHWGIREHQQQYLLSSSVHCPADSRIKFDPTGNSLPLAWGAWPNSPWPGLPMATYAFIGSRNVLVSLSSSCLLLLLLLVLPSSLGQRVETSQGTVIGQRWYKNINILHLSIGHIWKIAWKFSEHIPLTFGTTLQ